MPRALEIARTGDCSGFQHVVNLMKDEGLVVRLWASVSDRDAIDRACTEGRARRVVA